MSSGTVKGQTAVLPASYDTGSDQIPFPKWMIEDLSKSGITPEQAQNRGFQKKSGSEIRQLLGRRSDLGEGYSTPYYEPGTGHARPPRQ